MSTCGDFLDDISIRPYVFSLHMSSAPSIMGYSGIDHGI